MKTLILNVRHKKNVKKFRYTLYINRKLYFSSSKQASKHIYLLTQVRVSGSFTADVDLQLVPPELIFYNEYPGYSFTDLGRMDS